MEISEALEKIKKIQEQVEHSGNIKRLIGGQRTKYNIYNQEGAREGNAYRNTQSAFIKFTGQTFALLND